MSKFPDRKEVLLRAVALRAGIISFLNRQHDSKQFTSTQILKANAAKFKKLQVTPKVLSFQLKQLSDNGLIHVTTEGRTNLYSSETVRAKPGKKPKVEVIIKAKKGVALPVFKVDVIKNTERLRITLRDAVFEIGVVTE